MVKLTKFSDIKNRELLRQEIITFFNHDDYLSINIEAVKKKGWICAQMEKDERQIFDNDAINLTNALKELGCSHIYGAHFVNVYKDTEFEVVKMPVKKEIIELVQTDFDYLIDLDDSFIFSEYPLRFLILRPVYTISAYMYIIGEVDFIRKACAEYGWTINCFED